MKHEFSPLVFGIWLPGFSSARGRFVLASGREFRMFLRANFPHMADPLILRLKQLIISTLNLEGVTPAEIDENIPLIGSGLALDSIDALELVVKLEKEFGIKISSSEESRTALASISSLAGFIRERTGEKAEGPKT